MSTTAAIAWHDAPDWGVRSAIALDIGLWRMRNGHTAEIQKLLQLPYQSNGKPMLFNVWKGRCVDCNEPLTWNTNGTYAAVGKHQFDIVGRA